MQPSAISTLFAAVDSVVAYEGRGMPPGVAGPVWRVVAALRDSHAEALADAAAAISLDIHRLTIALRRQDLTADHEVAAIKRDLQRACWQHFHAFTLSSAAPDPVAH